MKHFWKYTLPIHIVAIASIPYVILTSNWLVFIAAFLMWCLMSIGVEVGIHRLFSHKSFTTKRWIEVLLMYFGTIAGQGSVLFWVAIHKGYHHPHSDTLKDPHSPVHGFYHSYVGWLLDDTQTKINFRSVADLMRDPTQMFFHKHYYSVIVATLVILALINPVLLFAYALASAIAIQQNFIVNYVCHVSKFGSVRYIVKDRSRNITKLSLLTWGLSLHNNHHYDPGCYNLARDNEIDLSAKIIKLIGTNLRLPRD